MKQSMRLIIQFANHQSDDKAKVTCLIKGILFLLFLISALRHDAEFMASSHLHEAGADVYPLF